MIVRRSMDPGWLSNAYLVYSEAGGEAVFVDSGAPLGPLVAEVEREGLTVTTLLTTHRHADHVAGDEELERRFGISATPVADGDVVEAAGLEFRVLGTPGHSPDGVSFVAEGACFSGDTLFRDAVGGTRDAFEDVRRSVMDVLMALPPQTVVHPGHTEPTTIGREWKENPFVRVWRGLDPEGTEPCRVAGQRATVIVWSPDYDGKGKAWVRLAEDGDAIVGGSHVER